MALERECAFLAFLWENLRNNFVEKNSMIGIAMSQAFDILSSAVDDAIENSKAKKKFLREKTLSIEIESLNESIHSAVENCKSQNRPMEDAVEAICITLGLSEEVAREKVLAVWDG